MVNARNPGQNPGRYFGFRLPEVVMASNTAATSVKRKNKHEKAGRRRKNKLARKSTKSAVELFASLGEPGKPAPKH